LTESSVPDQRIRFVAGAGCADEVAVALDPGAGAVVLPQPRPQLAHTLDRGGGDVLSGSGHQRDAVPRAVAAGLGGLLASGSAPLHGDAVGAHPEAVADVGPPARGPHVEPSGVLPVLAARRVRLL